MYDWNEMYKRHFYKWKNPLQDYDRSKNYDRQKNMIISKSEALKSSDATLRDVAFGFGKAGVVLLEVTLIWEVMLDCDVLWFCGIIYTYIYMLHIIYIQF